MWLKHSSAIVQLFFSLLHEFTNACIRYDVICCTKYISVIKCYWIENDYRLSDSVATSKCYSDGGGEYIQSTSQAYESNLNVTLTLHRYAVVLVLEWHSCL